MGMRGGGGYEGHAALVPMALAFFVGIFVARGSDVLNVKITTTFGQLAAAWFIGFLLAHMVTRAMDGGRHRHPRDPRDQRERFAPRFPPPLVGPVLPEFAPPRAVQGRAYRPSRPVPTAPPGPAVPADDDDGFGATWDTVPTTPPRATPSPTQSPAKTMPPVPRPANSILPSRTRAPFTAPPTAKTWPPRSGSSSTFAPTERPTLAYPMAEEDVGDE